MRILSIFKQAIQRLQRLERQHYLIQEALGRIEARQLTTSRIRDLRDAEFRVFSQWGEDGIVEHLVTLVPIEHRIFVEFGVQDYAEANTRFLLVNRNWSGLVIDNDQDNVEAIRRSELYWRYNLKAECAFITCENINPLLRATGLAGDVGLLSVDIDGNDYWIWQAIDVVTPRIVVIEYNARFGPERAVTIPYNANFVRGKAHHSQIYYGASLRALQFLGNRKGYGLVACNSAGNNAFFVRRDYLSPGLPERSARDVFVPHAFREARNERGELLHLSPTEEIRLLEGLPVEEVAP